MVKCLKHIKKYFSFIYLGEKPLFQTLTLVFKTYVNFGKTY